MAHKRPAAEPPCESARDHLLRVLRSDDFRKKRLLSLETLEARCGIRLWQVRRAETCLGTFAVMRIALSEFDVAVLHPVVGCWILFIQTLRAFRRAKGFGGV